MNRAQAYGDGLFETMRFSKGRVLFAEEHYFRLMAGMRILRMPIPISWSPLGWLELLGLSENAGDHDLRVRFQVWRDGPLGYAPSPDATVSWSVEWSELPEVGYPDPLKRPTLGVFLEHRKSSGLLGTVKSSNSLLYVLAAGFARENRVDEVLILNNEHQVLEGASSNIMMIQDGALITAPLNAGVLRGVMREVVLRLAPDLGLSVREALFNPFALQQADEVWLTNAIQGVAAVPHFRKTTYRCTLASQMQKLIMNQSETSQFQ